MQRFFLVNLIEVIDTKVATTQYPEAAYPEQQELLSSTELEARKTQLTLDLPGSHFNLSGQVTTLTKLRA